MLTPLLQFRQDRHLQQIRAVVMRAKEKNWLP